MIKGDLHVVKRLALIVAVLLLATSAGFPAYAADWPQFQKDADNSGIYSGATPLPTTTPTTTSVFTQKGGFFGIDSTPIYVTSGSTGYAYVFPTSNLYKYHTSGNNLVKDGELNVGVGGFQLCTPASDGSSIYLGVNAMFDQIQNGSFADGFNHWTTGSSAGSPTITTGTVGTTPCAVITGANEDGDGYVKQAGLTIGSTSVRVAFSYLLQKTGSDPAQKDVKVQTKRSSLPDTPANWQTIITTTSTTYDTWIPVNENIDSSYFDWVGYPYDFRFVFDYNTGSTVTCNFTDCQVITQSLGVQKVTGLGSGTLSLVPNFCSLSAGGQANTPLKYYQYGGQSYLLMGSWGGLTSAYYCIDPNATSAATAIRWTFTSGAAAGYYWAGACCVNDVAIFGDEAGKVHVVELNQTGNAAEVNQTNDSDGTPAYDLSSSSSEPVRSSISHYYDGSTHYLYLTTGDGYLYQLTYNPTTKQITQAGAPVRPQNYSTSTPVRYGNWVYVGMGRIYGGAGVWAVPVSGGSLGAYQRLDGTTLGAVQASPVVYPVNDTNEIYIYATENVTSGKAACVKFNPSNGTSQVTWTTASQNYVLQGLAAADGKLFYGDDSGNLYYAH